MTSKGKEWVIATGAPTVNPADADSLLAQAQSDRNRKRIKRQEDEDEAAHSARMADMAKKTATSEAAVEKTGEKHEETGGIKTKGEFNIGNFNIQEMLQQQIADRDRLKLEAENAAANQQQISNDLREKLHASEMLVLKTSFEAQMQLLTKMIEANASKGGFTDQLTAARAIAEEIGYQKGAPGGDGSEMIQIELKRLDFDHQIAMRNLNREDKAEEKRWQLELRRLDDERESNKAKLAIEEKKMEMFNQGPAILGNAIGRAIVDGGGGEGPVSQPPASSQAKMPGITAGVGEGGEADCIAPGCGAPVAIGPTAKSAVCAKCGAKYHIQRVQPEPEPEPETGPELEEEEQ